MEAPAVVPAGVREGVHDLISVGLLCSGARGFIYVIGSLVNVCFMDHDGMLGTDICGLSLARLVIGCQHGVGRG